MSGVALSLCTFAACGLSIPGLVFGAADPSSTRLETSLTAPEVMANGDDEAQAASAGTVLATLPWGSDQGQVGLQAPGEGLVRGPEAVAVAPDGRIAVLDSVNRRLVVLNRDGEYAGTLPVPLSEPRFLATTDTRLYVLDADSDQNLVVLDWTGRELSRLDLPQLDDVVTGLFATTEGPCVEIAHTSTFLLSMETTSGASKATLRNLPGRPIGNDLSRAANATFAPNTGLRIAATTVDRKNLRASHSSETRPTLARGRTIEHLVSIDDDGRGGLVVGAHLLNEGANRATAPALLLTRVTTGLGWGDQTSADAAEAGSNDNTGDTLLLADSTFAYLGQPYVVAPDGRIIQPVADESGYSLLIHTFPQAAKVRP